MTIVVDLTLPGGAFPLGTLLDDDPDAHVELERVVPVGDRLLPFFWVSDGSVEHIESMLAEQAEVGEYELLTTAGDQHLYEVRWNSDLDGIVPAIEDNEGAILNGRGVRGRWELRLRFPDHDRLKAFSERCRESGVRFEVNGVYNPHVPSAKDRLTPKQWETMSVAHELGYFEVPRRATLAELADHFGVSEQAVSQRIRRALNTLLSVHQFEPDTR
ncbi:helix-turn-helix domain-containing protein [Halomarina oriensis]|uniref:Bacterio-opsin activator n=1 Tax=Halomarina oriensis TaxID=671145 RepID=A0A6B0GJJ9_9EURY|nr:helix-turn-helix domain-containing protein [Halomarina oriensis]MWG34017.1 bacterio-opsin activator [Halomarina oriensis]